MTISVGLIVVYCVEPFSDVPFWGWQSLLVIC